MCRLLPHQTIWFSQCCESVLNLQGSREELGITALDAWLPRGLRVDCLMLL